MSRGMRLLIAIVAAIALVIPNVAIAGSGGGATGSQGYAPDRVLVKFRPGTPAADISRIEAEHGVREIDRIDKLGVRVLTVPKGRTVKQMVGALYRNPNVLYAEPDAYVIATMTPNDTCWSQQSDARSISVEQGWDVSTGSESVVVAVIDTGVDASHPDLQGRIVAGYDFVNNDSDPTDDHDHGTAVAGIIAATGNNGIGVAGMDWRAKIMPVKVLGSNAAGVTSGVVKGILWAADHGASVINLSLVSVDITTLHDAVKLAVAKGVVVVGAAGNDGMELPLYPAAYPEAIAVSAWDTDRPAIYSNYGSHVDVAAPGVTVYTTMLGGGYGLFSGTSASAPFVSGLAALVRGVNPSLSPAQVASVLTSTATDVAAVGWDTQTGAGLINVARALNSLGGVPAPDPIPAPAPVPEPVPVPVVPPADSTVPIVSVSSPSAGSVAKRTVTVTLKATDDVGVARVDVYVDGKLVGADSSATYSVAWNTRTVTDGPHAIVARAYDAAGNRGESSAVTVTVANGVVKKK